MIFPYLAAFQKLGQGSFTLLCGNFDLQKGPLRVANSLCKQQVSHAKDMKTKWPTNFSNDALKPFLVEFDSPQCFASLPRCQND